MDKDRQYALFLWILTAAFLILLISFEIFPILPVPLEFISILIGFFCLLAGVFAVYYSYNVIEVVMKRRKKRKKALKSVDEKKSE